MVIRQTTQRETRDARRREEVMPLYYIVFCVMLIYCVRLKRVIVTEIAADVILRGVTRRLHFAARPGLVETVFLYVGKITK